MVCGKEVSTGEIIATSANQIVPPEIPQRYKMLYYICQIPHSSWRVEGGSGYETTLPPIALVHMEWRLGNKIEWHLVCRHLMKLT